MKKNLHIVVIVSIIGFLSNYNLYANSFHHTIFESSILAVSPPAVTTPIYLCQGSTATPLTATPSAGNTLIWYTVATGGTGSATAPTPSTTTVGSTSYYVSETDGVTVSARSQIVVNVVADNGSKILLLHCDPSQIALVDKYSSVFFEWTNTSGLPNQYTYSYSIDGGAAINGTTIPTHVQVFGLSPGQSVTLTVSHTTYPCDRSVIICSVPCLTLSTPTFDPIPPVCSGSPAPPLPATSKEGIKGTWFPAAINNTTSGSYVFTPNANECANKVTINVVVNPDSPGFSSFEICSGSFPPNLDTTSPTGVTGTWNPPAVDNINSDSYTFTPDPGQCAAPQTIDVTVIPSNTLVDFSWTVTEAFAENQIITITADAPSDNYVYRLDDGPFQSSAVFEHVASGLHSVTVADQMSCSPSITKTDILVVNFPKFFTPNNDGYNDYWNVPELNTQSSAYIRIFDRYGKFLKQISPNGIGWNGTYNGHFLPADDYWFVIHYNENNIIKEFRSHFSLKR